MVDQMDGSGFNWKGHVLEDLVRDQVQIKVSCPAGLPGSLSGTFGPGQTKSTVSTKNLLGASESSSMTTTNYIIATWEGDDNRPLPPTVRKGEQIYVYQDHDSDKFFWRALGRDRNLRTTDRHRIEIAATGKANVEKTDACSYVIEMDSDSTTQHLLIKTSAANGEMTPLSIKLDGKNGNIAISDNVGGTDGPNNRILIDTANQQIQLNNQSRTTITLKGEDVIISAPRDILMNAGRQVVVNSPLFTLNEDTKGSVVFNADNLAINASGSIVGVSPSIGFNGSVKVDGPLITPLVRAASYVTGDFGNPYTAVTIQTDVARDSIVNNSPDSGSTGTMRTAMAYATTLKLATAIEEKFAEVKSKTGAPGDSSGLSDIVSSDGELHNLKDQ